MTHPIFAKWPAQHPDRLQLYSFPTPNGIKVSAIILFIVTGLVAVLLTFFGRPVGQADVTHLWSHGGFFPLISRSAHRSHWGAVVDRGRDRPRAVR